MKLKPLKLDTSMRDKHLELRDGKYYFINSTGNETELLGMHCKAFHLDGAYYFQYDAGHFMSKFINVKISKDEFLSLRSSDISFDDLHEKYAKSTSS